MLKLTRRGRIWHIVGTTGPAERREVVRESTGTSDRAIAEALRAKREREVYERAIYGDRAVVTFAQAVHSFTETRPGIAAGDKRRLNRLLDHFGLGAKLSEIGQAAVDAAAAAICPDASPATKLRAVVSPISAVLNHAARRGWCARPMLERPEPARRRTDWLTPAQAEALLAAAVPHMRPLLLFLLGTGARVGEALALPWSDVDLNAGVATFRNTEDRRTKSGRDRTVHLPPTVIVALGNLAHRDGAVFRTPAWRVERDHETGELRRVQVTGPAYRGGSFKTAWRGTMRRAGLLDEAGEPLCSPHALRHTWASWRYCLKPNALDLMHAGGWSSLDLVARYAHVTPADMAAGIVAAWGAHPDQFLAQRRAAPAEQKREAG